MPVSILPRALKPFGLLALSLSLLAGCNATTPAKNQTATNAEEGFKSAQSRAHDHRRLPHSRR